MGRKKGKQSGNHHNKRLNAAHRHTVYVDHASEAYDYRNPASERGGVLGKGRGYRNAWNDDDRGIGSGRGFHHYGGGSFGGGSSGNVVDKWSSIFSTNARSSRNLAPSLQSTRSSPLVVSSLPHSVIANANSRLSSNPSVGLARLRFLLEERRLEDRIQDRAIRLRVQRSRIREVPSVSAVGSTTGAVRVSAVSPGMEDRRHEIGWLLSHSFDEVRCNDAVGKHSDSGSESLPSPQSPQSPQSLQSLAARTLGPLLPLYGSYCGHDYVGECLKSVSPNILSELSIHLATYSADADDSNEKVGGVTNGVVKALVHSGVATGLVFRGVPISRGEDDEFDRTMAESESGEEDLRDCQSLNDYGLLSLCPRINPHKLHKPLGEDVGSCALFTSCASLDANGDEDGDASDDWESLNVDMDLTARMTGCFHLKRLELIDVPLGLRPLKISGTHKSATALGSGGMFGSGTSRGGISLQALRHVFRSCPGITHLSLSGCFNDSNSLSHVTSTAMDESEDVTLLLAGGYGDIFFTIHSIEHALQALDILHSTFVNNGRGVRCDDRRDDRHFSSSDDDNGCDILGLDSLLPELQVLDVSHCDWVTPTSIFQLVVNCWKRAYVSHYGRQTNRNSYRKFGKSDWKEECNGSGGNGPSGRGGEECNADITETTNNGLPSCVNDEVGATDANNDPFFRKNLAADVCTKLRHLNVRGCKGLLSYQPISLPLAPSFHARRQSNIGELVEEWRKTMLFHGIDISTERQIRRF